MRFTADDFEAWRHSGITELILDRFVAAEMRVTREQHDAAAWNGPLEPEEHAAYRARHDTLELIRHLTFEDVEAWLREQAETETE